MAYSDPAFVVEVVDGYPLGKLQVPLVQVADWLNFLATPHYRAEIVMAEQGGDRLSIYFAASEGLYTYLQTRLHAQPQLAA